jgi:vancomycin resistance protein YoaR
MMRTAMTTIDGVLTPETEPITPEAGTTVARRRRVWPRLLIGFVIGFLLCLGLAAGALLVYDGSYDGRVLSGVSVRGVDLSGQDRDQAAATLGAAFAGYSDGQVVVMTSEGPVEVPYAAFSRRADVPAMVEAALRVGRTGTPLERAVEEVRLAVSGLSLEPRVTLDSAALAERIQTAVSRFDRQPVDSRLLVGPKVITVTRAFPGRAFDGTAAAAAAFETLQYPDAPAEVSVDATVTTTPPAHGVPEALEVRAAAQRMMKPVVVTLGKKQWKIKAATVRSWIDIEVRPDGSSWPVVDEAAISKSLGKVAKAVKRTPVSAKFLKTRGGRIVGVAPATDGRRLDPDRTAAAIAAALLDRAGGAPVAPVKVKTAKVEPKLTTAEAVKKGPLMVMLGSWKTWFPVSERNYWGANIWQPAKIIDGKVLMPGQRFEWWSAIGPVNSATGFGPGGFIAGNHTEPTGALGGGMCSSSTTLFNAALRAGLKMGARDNHKYYIYRYPLGLDATVSKTRGGGGQTMSFTNDMKTPIVIRSFRYTAGGKGWVRYEIWGIPDGRKVSLSKPSVANVRKAITETVYTSRLKPGVREQTESPANGMDVSVTRTVRRNGKVIHRETYRTHYVLWNGRIEIGR